MMLREAQGVIMMMTSRRIVWTGDRFECSDRDLPDELRSLRPFRPMHLPRMFLQKPSIESLVKRLCHQDAFSPRPLNI